MPAKLCPIGTSLIGKLQQAFECTVFHASTIGSVVLVLGLEIRMMIVSFGNLRRIVGRPAKSDWSSVQSLHELATLIVVCTS